MSFNKMAGSMQSLIDKVKEDERKMRKADLRLLQEQIQPHFLYNTLDTIVWLIESNEPDEAVTMVVTLSDFFREILSKGKEFISIKEEEKHISSYLQIQEMRYRDILEYDIQLDQVIYKYQILKLTFSQWWRMHFTMESNINVPKAVFTFTGKKRAILSV